MSESKRTPVYQDYYSVEDYDYVMGQLPEIVKEAEKRAAEIIEPTIHEKKKVMNSIRDFIRKKKRKVYGGTAINELIKEKNPRDAIYDEYKFSDIEFYSPNPVGDLVELTNALYEAGYPFVQGKEAQHEETYSIFVNFVLYCDISYVPTRVYNGIKTIEIDGISYTDPHFIFIDQLRIMNDPLNANYLWEKTFHRMYLLLEYYPLEYFNKPINIPKPSAEIQNLISETKKTFLKMKEIQDSCLISGFDAYNFDIDYASQKINTDTMSRNNYGKNKVTNLKCNVPFLDLVSVNYKDIVEKTYNFIRDNATDKIDVTIEEYYPFFQFQERSVFIKYKGEPVVRIIEANGRCVPNFRTTQGYMYVSYQYLLMSLMINKFRSFLDNNKDMYFNYSTAISNLVQTRNIFLDKNNLEVINKTIFGEFKISCVGSTVSYARIGHLRRQQKKKKGKAPVFMYEPEKFFMLSEESQAKFDPTKHNFRNSSGNLVTNAKNLMFVTDLKGNIVYDTNSEENTDTDSESDNEETQN